MQQGQRNDSAVPHSASVLSTAKLHAVSLSGTWTLGADVPDSHPTWEEVCCSGLDCVVIGCIRFYRILSFRSMKILLLYSVRDDLLCCWMCELFLIVLVSFQMPPAAEVTIERVVLEEIANTLKEPAIALDAGTAAAVASRAGEMSAYDELARETNEQQRSEQERRKTDACLQLQQLLAFSSNSSGTMTEEAAAQPVLTFFSIAGSLSALRRCIETAVSDDLLEAATRVVMLLTGTFVAVRALVTAGLADALFARLKSSVPDSETHRLLAAAIGKLTSTFKALEERPQMPQVDAMASPVAAHTAADAEQPLTTDALLAAEDESPLQSSRAGLHLTSTAESFALALREPTPAQPLSYVAATLVARLLRDANVTSVHDLCESTKHLFCCRWVVAVIVLPCRVV